MNFFGVLDFFVLIQSCLGAKILLIGETNDTQLMDLFQESKSNNFEIISIEVDHDQEDAAQNTSFCGYIGKQVYSSVSNKSPGMLILFWNFFPSWMPY